MMIVTLLTTVLMSLSSHAWDNNPDEDSAAGVTDGAGVEWNEKCEGRCNRMASQVPLEANTNPGQGSSNANGSTEGTN